MIAKPAAIAVACSLAFHLVSQNALAAGPTAAWELRQLHQPSDTLIENERRGRVTIYDGVTVAEIDKALDNQFDRIDAMMFVRTQHQTPEGDYFADDDCD